MVKFKVFLDYDNMSLAKVLDEVKRLAEKYDLGGFVVKKSSPLHYHVIFDKELDSFERVKEVVLESSADQKFKECLYMGFSTLRLVPSCRKKFMPREIIKVEGKWLNTSPKGAGGSS